MLAPELKHLKKQIENNEELVVDPQKLLEELQELDDTPTYLAHSLSISGKVCPTCGRRLI